MKFWGWFVTQQENHNFGFYNTAKNFVGRLSDRDKMLQQTFRRHHGISVATVNARAGTSLICDML